MVSEALWPESGGMNPPSAKVASARSQCLAANYANKYRKETITGVMGTFKNGQNIMGKEPWKTCIFWGTIFLG